MTVSLVISDRARKYGYIFWSKADEGDVRRLIGARDAVRVVFEGKDLGLKRVDWKYRRISVGRKHTGHLDQGGSFVLRLAGSDELGVTCVWQ